MTDAADPPRPSDSVPMIAEHGSGDVRAAVVSMSSRHPDGRDAAYLEWHVLDHLPEQHRLAGMRFGQRWVSTPACRRARAASIAPFDAVDHVVQYLFAEPFATALDQFFPLGAALRGIGRMPIVLPRVQVGGWDLDGAVAADRVLVGAAVLPWRPTKGVYALVERVDAGDGTRPGERLGDLVAVAGVAGAWGYAGTQPRHDRLESTAGLALTVCYLDEPPLEVAAAMVPVLAERWDRGGIEPLLAGPFEMVVPGSWDLYLP
ncbi:MAG: hypothetical protein ACXWA3_03685 [Acidimicrobiales bacterium]